MVEIKGKYNTCKVFTDNIDEVTISQLTGIMNQEVMKDEKIRIMPDCHSGKGAVIGTTMTLHQNKVVPNLVGCDVGCGMLVIKLKDKRIDLPKLDSVIHKYIPSGMNINDEPIEKSNIDKMIAQVNLDRAYRSIGTLGGGNHFIEVDKDNDGYLYLVIHTGSRHLGIEVCDYWQEKGYSELIRKANPRDLKVLTREKIEELKSQGREKEISNELKRIRKEYKATSINIPYELAYVEDDNFNGYIHDMKLAQEFASINREVIADRILKYAKLKEEYRFETVHNYIDIEHMIARKGSVSARKNEKLIIPMNMRDGSLICIGKGNDDWNQSAPHGAGRIMSRTQARNSVSMKEFKESMQGIFTTCVNGDTIDESPMVYKPMEDIMRDIKDTVDIVNVIKPIYNFKASEVKSFTK